MNDELVSLRVKGNMYADALICDGDIVVLKKQSVADNGDLACVWLKDTREMVVRRYQRFANETVRLQACNGCAPPIYTHDESIEIHGKVLIVIRQVPQ